MSHRDQRSLLWQDLDAADLGDVVVDTANKLHRLTLEVPPLAGPPDVDESHHDP